MRITDQLNAIAQATCAAKYPSERVTVEWRDGRMRVVMSALRGNVEALLPDDPNEWDEEAVASAIGEGARLVGARPEPWE